METASYVHNYCNLSGTQSPFTKVINSYDLLAMRVKKLSPVLNQKQLDKNMETLFEQICVKTDCDIISIDASFRSPFFF